jgi:hypothetical protein
MDYGEGKTVFQNGSDSSDGDSTLASQNTGASQRSGSVLNYSNKSLSRAESIGERRDQTESKGKRSQANLNISDESLIENAPMPYEESTMKVVRSSEERNQLDRKKRITTANPSRPPLLRVQSLSSLQKNSANRPGSAVRGAALPSQYSCYLNNLETVLNLKINDDLVSDAKGLYSKNLL